MTKISKSKNIQIVVLQRGWVAVGEVKDDKDHIIIENAKIT